MKLLPMILMIVACTGVSHSAETNGPSPHAQYPFTGMTASDLNACVTEIAGQIPSNEKIISLWIKSETEVTVGLGELKRPRTGGGRAITFKKHDGKWVKSGTGGWMT